MTKNMDELFSLAKNAQVKMPVQSIDKMLGQVKYVNGINTKLGGSLNLPKLIIMIGSIVGVITAVVLLTPSKTIETSNDQAILKFEEPMAIVQSVEPDELVKDEIYEEKLIEVINEPVKQNVTEVKSEPIAVIDEEPEIFIEKIVPTEVPVVPEFPSQEKDNVVVKPTTDIGDFNSILLNTGVRVVVKYGDKPGYEVIGGKEATEKYQIKVANNVLIINIKNKFNYKKSGGKEMYVLVTMNTLKSAKINGSGDIKIKDGIPSSNLSLTINGSGDIEVDKIVPESLKLTINGSGNVEFGGSGVATKADLKINGSGDIEIASIKFETLDVVIRGSGDILAFCEKKINADISGSGDVTYKGSAKVTVRSIGSGEVTKIGD